MIFILKQVLDQQSFTNVQLPEYVCNECMHVAKSERNGGGFHFGVSLGQVMITAEARHRARIRFLSNSLSHHAVNYIFQCSNYSDE